MRDPSPLRWLASACLRPPGRYCRDLKSDGKRARKSVLNTDKGSTLVYHHAALWIERHYEEGGRYENDSSRTSVGFCACASFVCRHGSAGAKQGELPQSRAAADRPECPWGRV